MSSNPESRITIGFEFDASHCADAAESGTQGDGLTGALLTNNAFQGSTFIVLFNVFDDAGVPLLFFKLEKDLWPCTKSFLSYLGRIPEYPLTELNNIQEDDYCLEQLKAI